MFEDVYVKPQVFQIEPHIIFTKIKISSLSISFLQMYFFFYRKLFLLLLFHLGFISSFPINWK